jgi:cbb3-type cytochrome oxidase maturation protein
MNMIYVLIGCSIVLALVFLAAFFWASRTGQHDDTYTPSVRILFDDDLPGPKAPKSDEDQV